MSRRVSITFRLSALSALVVPFNGVTRQEGVSITFRLSALSAHEMETTGLDGRVVVGLNYLSAQCPFGTRVGRPFQRL